MASFNAKMRLETALVLLIQDDHSSTPLLSDSLSLSFFMSCAAAVVAVQEVAEPVEVMVTADGKYTNILVIANNI